MSTPAISVNMCVYRPHPVYFRQAVESILNQTLEDFELVIVEDPSEVDGRELIPDLIQDPRVVYVHNEQRKRLVAQRNQALERSVADWVAILDADDIAKPDRLAKQWEFIQSHPEMDVVGSWIEIIDDAGNTIASRRYPVTHGDIARTMRRYNPIAQPAVAFSKVAVQSAGGYQKMSVEDYELWCRMLKMAHILLMSPNI